MSLESCQMGISGIGFPYPKLVDDMVPDEFYSNLVNCNLREHKLEHLELVNSDLRKHEEQGKLYLLKYFCSLLDFLNYS